MRAATERLRCAFESKEKILIYGDYDVDGTTSITLVFGVLRKKYEYLQFYVPDRYSEGYGISFKSLEWAKEHGISLIIALDCGIKSIEHVRRAKEYGIDLTERAKQGKLDPVIGRDEEIRRTIQILSRRTKNNPALIGSAGVGKTSIGKSIARALNRLHNRRAVVRVDT